MRQKKELFDQAYELVVQIPRGEVATYGDIAKVVGVSPRYIGYILHNNPYPGRVPCHRVVNSEGRVAASFAFGGGLAQQKLLEAEGVAFHDGRLDLRTYRHYF